MAIRVGRWDCFVCGHVGNHGPKTHCEDCGASRPKDVQFYLLEDEEVIKSSDIVEEAKSGADWICSYCSSHNKVSQSNCQTCGNDRVVEEDVSIIEKDYTLDAVPNIGSRGVKRVTPVPEKLKGRAGFWKYLLGATGLGGVFYWLFGFSTAIDVPVVEMSWERKIAVEEYREVREENWDLPSGATDVESFQAIFNYRKDIVGYQTKTETVKEQVGTRQVVCGKKDLGNGYFEDKYCNEPVYENVKKQVEVPIYKETPIYKRKHRYNIFKWVETDPLVSSGNSNPATWAKDTPQMLANPDKFRHGKESEMYRFWIEYKGERIEHETKSYDFFKNLKVGNTIKAYKSTVFGTYKGLKAEGVK
jgi:hypothetical protein